MIHQVVEVTTATSVMHQISQISMHASSDEDSFAGDSCAEDEILGDEVRHIQATCDCIDDALAVLTSPLDEAKQTVSALPPSQLTLAPFCFDSPPCRPKRSFETAPKSNRERPQSVCGHNRFQLSKSEHTSRSFRAQNRPNRSASGSGPSPDASQQSSRDLMMRVPSRKSSGKSARQRQKEHDEEGQVTLRTPNTRVHDEEGQVTLRTPNNRVLRGNRELSSSQHLRRACPRLESRDKDININGLSPL